MLCAVPSPRKHHQHPSPHRPMETVAKGPERYLLLTGQGSGMWLTLEDSTAASPPFQIAIANGYSCFFVSSDSVHPMTTPQLRTDVFRSSSNYPRASNMQGRWMSFHLRPGKMAVPSDNPSFPFK